MVSITPYQKDIESYLPNKNKIIASFISISKKIGKEKMIWRYDPICITNVYTVSYHIEIFKKMCHRLKDYTETVIISFVDIYSNIKNKYRELSTQEIETISEAFSKIAKENGLTIQTCVEKYDLSKYEIRNTACVNQMWVEKIIGKLDTIPTNHVRKHCHCLQTIDIGSYDSCLPGCTYCYACSTNQKSIINYKNHNIDSAILIDKINNDVKMTDKKMISYR